MPPLLTLSRPTSLMLTAALFLAGEALLAPAPLWADPAPKAGNQIRNFSAADIETADYTTGDLPAGQSALTAKVQILLDRSGISPGVVDGWRGGMSESAIRAFQRRAHLPMDGRMSPVVWQLLQPYAEGALTMEYTITEADAEGLVDNIPTDYAEKAKMSSQGYTSILEKLSERFHMDEKFLQKLNPGVSFTPGATIKATVPAKPIRASVTRIIVDKATRRVAAYDAKGNMVADYPATVGSDATPSPHGIHKVDAVALNPTYTYNPNKNFKQGKNDRVLTVPPGPNGPVGDVWIDLSQPTYGIHGTATPSRLFVNQSYGCVRLTNWDARELAHMVKAGTTTVEFLAPGVSIADVTGTSAGTAAGAAAGTAASGAAHAVATAVTATRPRARPLRDPNAVAAVAETEIEAETPAAAPAPATGTVAAPAASTAPAAASTATATTPPPASAGLPEVHGTDALSNAIAEAVTPNVPVSATTLPPPNAAATIPATAPAAASIAPNPPPRRASPAAAPQAAAPTIN